MSMKDLVLIRKLKELEEQGASKEERTKIFNEIPNKYKVKICLGCGVRYEDRDCGCPAGSAESLRTETEIEKLMRK